MSIYCFLLPDPQLPLNISLAALLLPDVGDTWRAKPISSLWPAPLWNGLCWERDQKGLWSALLNHNLALQTEAMFILTLPQRRLSKISISWAGPAQVPKAARRRIFLAGPQSREIWAKWGCRERVQCTLQKGAPSQNSLDFRPCKLFTWILPITDAFAGHG